MDDWREEIKAELCYLMFTWNGMECTITSAVERRDAAICKGKFKNNIVHSTTHNTKS